ncbi:KAP family P-loop NTPase fold protein [Penaeicola halotolerans]|uniref:KAP family P-loop NTPase fold protein n=1 Tax=Penaeicola halotolerans TaxID=2793196 RepID=UPI001CF88328|nr:P-loop NTPase fold protein [Penaeicola halotolerans]
MKIKHHEIEIPQENPFANCKLAREPYASILTDIVNTYSDGFVLAINNEWGAGKTTFVKMWQQQLKNEGFQTIYFNAWENDFDNNPLVALVSELQTLTNEKNKEVFKSVVEKGAVLVKNIAPALVKSLIKKYVADIDDIAINSIEDATKASTEILEEELKEYASKKKTIIEFRKELEKFVKQADNSKPLIFIVDELDRCRPNYSVEVLEQIKHFFSVSGIVFVLSIDKNHLASAVKGFYGSEQIDSNEYLRRFIDLEYSIPKPSTEDFTKYLFEYYSFDSFFYSEERLRIGFFPYDSDKFLSMANFLFTNLNATLRQQERIFALTRLVLCSFKSNQLTFSDLLFILVYLKIMRNDDFQKIERNDFSLQELSDLFFDITFSKKNESNGISFLYIESLLLWFYNNDRDYSKKINLIKEDDAGNLSVPIKSKLENETQSTNLIQCLSNINNHWDHNNIKLNYLIRKINLTESVTIQ